MKKKLVLYIEQYYEFYRSPAMGAKADKTRQCG
jgi:hypothetical protein